MKCEEVREVLAEHLLGTLDEVTDAAVRRHLRGCGGCRQDAAALGEGIGTIARAHEVVPPEALEQVVANALSEEWASSDSKLSADSKKLDSKASDSKARADDSRSLFRRSGRVVSWVGVAAAIVLVAASISLAVSYHSREVSLKAEAVHYQSEATRYEKFLGTLGGENVRVGSLQAPGSQSSIHGSVVLYDSATGQNWAMVLVQAPGLQGRAHVTLTAVNGETMTLHPLQFSSGGEASTFMVTSSSLKNYRKAALYGPDGTMLASGTVQ